MFKDKSLIPVEAIRLAALGLLAEAPRSYADLAATVRLLTSRIVGPSLDLIAPPLELLRFEGLVEPACGSAADGEGQLPDTAILALTGTGTAALHRLLRAPVRAPMNDTNRLIVALKIRFLPLMPEAERRDQLDMLVEITEQEQARLEDLRRGAASDGALMDAWIDHEIEQVTTRLRWFDGLRAAA